MKDQSVINPTHTPTPWKISQCTNGDIYIGGHEWVLKIVAKVDFTVMPKEANAAFIVRAVNAYDGLIEALKEIAEGKGAYSQNQFEHCKNTVRDMKALAIEALAKAEGKE